jgi:tRNA A37 threonylcarbamoyladenosine modification protein TsaB
LSQARKQHIDIVIISISTPIKVGLYKDKILFEEITADEMTSEFLPKFFDEILKKYEIDNIIYSNGPGSYMSIKLTYIFLKTLQISKNINILAVDGFYFNQNSPIKAVGNRFFVKENDTITIKKAESNNLFELPQNLNFSDFSNEIEPFYILNAV